MADSGSLSTLRQFVKDAQSPPRSKGSGSLLRSLTDGRQSVVAFVNGLGTTSTRPPLRELAEGLLASGVDVWEFTYADDGVSPYQPQHTVQWPTLDRYVQHLDRQIQSLTGRTVLCVGHSQGA